MTGYSVLTIASTSLTVRGACGRLGRFAAALAIMASAAGGGRDAAGGDHEGDAYHDESPLGPSLGDPLPVQGEYHVNPALWANYDGGSTFAEARRAIFKD